MQRAHVVVVESVYFYNPNYPCTPVESSFHRMLDSDEQPVVRHMMPAGLEWTPLEHGWLSVISQVVIKNTGKWTLEVRFKCSAGVFYIRPGHTSRFEPSDVTMLEVRSQEADGTYSITLIPG